MRFWDSFAADPAQVERSGIEAGRVREQGAVASDEIAPWDVAMKCSTELQH